MYLAVTDEIVDLTLRADMNLFEINTRNSLIKKKIETNFVMSKA